jgi:hypothetical protein
VSLIQHPEVDAFGVNVQLYQAPASPGQMQKLFHQAFMTVVYKKNPPIKILA